MRDGGVGGFLRPVLSGLIFGVRRAQRERSVPLLRRAASRGAADHAAAVVPKPQRAIHYLCRYRVRCRQHHIRLHRRQPEGHSAVSSRRQPRRRGRPGHRHRHADRRLVSVAGRRRVRRPRRDSRADQPLARGLAARAAHSVGVVHFTALAASVERALQREGGRERGARQPGFVPQRWRSPLPPYCGQLGERSSALERHRRRGGGVARAACARRHGCDGASLGRRTRLSCLHCDLLGRRRLADSLAR